ncbi:translation initiation factor IF-2-like [Vidua macroura]|uniref:translation initiation factor IF-2-like n=1 Tax=Vidua macroura TaxID=187451 RepID=UPI0023A7FB02|nr:translation initiation factor IF-2-like [Vidua macroura]
MKFTLFSLLGRPLIRKNQLLGKKERPSLARHGGIRARCEPLNTTRQQTQKGERSINRSPGGSAGGPLLGAESVEERRGHRQLPQGPGGQRGERGRPGDGDGRLEGEARRAPAGGRAEELEVQRAHRPRGLRERPGAPAPERAGRPNPGRARLWGLSRPGVGTWTGSCSTVILLSPASASWSPSPSGVAPVPARLRASHGGARPGRGSFEPAPTVTGASEAGGRRVRPNRRRKYPNRPPEIPEGAGGKSRASTENSWESRARQPGGNYSAPEMAEARRRWPRRDGDGRAGAEMIERERR